MRKCWLGTSTELVPQISKWHHPSHLGYRVHHGKVGIFNWLEWSHSNGYQNASKILFEGGFEILRLDIFRHYNEFSWNGYCVPSIRPNVSGPKFNSFFCFFCYFLYRISSYSFCGNYSFLNLEIQRSQDIRPKVTVHKFSLEMG